MLHGKSAAHSPSSSIRHDMTRRHLVSTGGMWGVSCPHQMALIMSRVGHEHLMHSSHYVERGRENEIRC